MVILLVIRYSLLWRDAPPEYGPHKTLYNRFVRCSPAGLFHDVFGDLAGKAGAPDRLLIDATYLKANQSSASLLAKKGQRRIGRTKAASTSSCTPFATNVATP